MIDNSFKRRDNTLQEELPEMLAKRPPIYAHEPVFCFETAIKAFYYSLVVYDYEGTARLRKVSEDLYEMYLLWDRLYSCVS